MYEYRLYGDIKLFGQAAAVRRRYSGGVDSVVFSRLFEVWS